ncbi:MAG: hypothetical protein ACYTBJ_11340 [Planctomycetota bacterium]|jgi:hypothetical protein
MARIRCKLFLSPVEVTDDEINEWLALFEDIEITNVVMITRKQMYVFYKEGI